MKKKSVRSPRFPFITLEKALEYLPDIAAIENDGELNRSKIIEAMGFESESGPAFRTIAAFRAYGLIRKGRGGPELSETGKALVENPGDLDSLRKAALSPLVFRAIWREARHANEDEIAELLEERRFSEEGAQKAAGIYLANAGLADLGSLEIEPELPERVDRSFPGGRHRRRGCRDAITLPLSTGMATIPVGITEEEFELFQETLKLWKTRIVK